MNVLYGFVWEVADNLPINSLKPEFLHLKQILDAGRTLPNKVLESIDAVKNTGQEMKMLACMESLAQGKAIMELAFTKAQERKGQMQHLADLEDVAAAVSELQAAKEGEGKFYVEDTLSKLNTALVKCMQLTGKISEGDQQREFATQSARQLIELVEYICEIHFEEDLGPWVADACTSLKDSQVLPSLPEFGIVRFRQVCDDLAGQPVMGNLKKLLGFYDMVAGVVTTSEEVTKSKADAGAACTALCNLQQESLNVTKCFPKSKLGALATSLITALEKVWNTYYTATITDALNEAASILMENMKAGADAFVGLEEEASLACVRKCGDAAWVTTGLKNEKDASTFKTVAQSCKHIIHVIQACLAPDGDTASICELIQLFKVIGCFPEDLKGIHLDIVPNEDAVKKAAALFHPFFVDKEASVAEDSILAFLVAWLAHQRGDGHGS